MRGKRITAERFGVVFLGACWVEGVDCGDFEMRILR